MLNSESKSYWNCIIRVKLIPIDLDWNCEMWDTNSKHYDFEYGFTWTHPFLSRVTTTRSQWHDWPTPTPFLRALVLHHNNVKVESIPSTAPGRFKTSNVLDCPLSCLREHALCSDSQCLVQVGGGWRIFPTVHGRRSVTDVIETCTWTHIHLDCRFWWTWI